MGMKVVDLFCGCGGLSLGFQKAGYDIAAAFDNWSAALCVYRRNLGDHAAMLDLSDTDTAVEKVSEYAPQMIIGGPPCQDFSSAGKRNEDNGRGDLTVSYAKIVSSVKPQWFVMENVARIVKTNKLVAAKELFKAAGYGLSYAVLDASLCGVPQKRKRFIMVGRIGAEDGFMDDIMQKSQSSKPLTVAEALGDKIDVKYYYRHPRSYIRRGVFSVDEPSPTIRGVNRPIPQGYTLHKGDPVDSLEGVRPLTTRERALIQTFPSDFEFIGSKSEQEQMIGNAVPVNLGTFVGKCIAEYIKGRDEGVK